MWKESEQLLILDLAGHIRDFSKVDLNETEKLLLLFVFSYRVNADKLTTGENKKGPRNEGRNRNLHLCNFLLYSRTGYFMSSYILALVFYVIYLLPILSYKEATMLCDKMFLKV